MDIEKNNLEGGALDQQCQFDSSVMIGGIVNITCVQPVCLNLVGADVKQQKNLFESNYYFPIAVKCILTTDTSRFFDE